jgi:hypothetical protein
MDSALGAFELTPVRIKGETVKVYQQLKPLLGFQEE